MKQSTLYRRTIALLTGVLLLCACVMLNQKRSIDSLRGHYTASQADLAEYQDMHQRDQQLIHEMEQQLNRQREVVGYMEKWLNDAARQPEQGQKNSL